VFDDVPSHGEPRADSAAPLTQTGIAHDSGVDRVVAVGYQLIAKGFVYEVFLCLALNKD
jgi:hypothetical protein